LSLDYTRTAYDVSTIERLAADIERRLGSVLP